APSRTRTLQKKTDSQKRLFLLYLPINIMRPTVSHPVPSWPSQSTMSPLPVKCRDADAAGLAQPVVQPAVGRADRLAGGRFFVPGGAGVVGAGSHRLGRRDERGAHRFLRADAAVPAAGRGDGG